MSGRMKTIGVFGLILAVHSLAFFLISSHGLIVDERFHYAQIYRFMHGDYSLDPALPMLPGYHLVLSGMGRMLGIGQMPYYQGVPSIRFLSFLFHLASIGVFYAIAIKINKQSSLIKTAQFSIFPLFFPFFPLLYTDLFSNLFLLVILWLILQRRFYWGGLVAGISLFIRQNNLIWLVFFNVLLYVQTNGYRCNRQHLIDHLKQSVTFFIGPMILAIYLLFNRSVVVGQETQSYFSGAPIHINNAIMILGYYAVLFLPLILSSGKEMASFCRKKKIYGVFVPFVFLLVFALFQNDHPLNGNPFFIHNALAMFAVETITTRLLLLVLVVLSLLSLAVVKLEDRSYRLFYLFSFLFLLPLWLMDLRYYVAPFTLFLLFRKARSNRVEYALLTFFLVLSVYFFYGVWSWHFFL